MATAALEAKRRVHVLLDEALTGQAIDVTYGPMRNPPRSWAFVGEVTYSDSEWAAVGARGRKETFDVSVTVNVILPGGNAADTENKTMGFADLFETAVRADPTLGGLAPAGVAVIPKRLRSQPSGTDTFEGQWDAVVRITGARI